MSCRGSWDFYGTFCFDYTIEEKSQEKHMRMSLCVSWDFYWAFCFCYTSEEKSRETHMHMSCRVSWDFYGAFCFYYSIEEKCQEKHMHMSCRSTREQLSALLGSKVCKSRVPQTSKRSLRSPRKPWSLEHVLDFQLWYTPTLHVELVVVLKNIVFLRAKRKPPVAPRVIVQLHRCRTRNCE